MAERISQRRAIKATVTAKRRHISMQPSKSSILSKKCTRVAAAAWQSEGGSSESKTNERYKAIGGRQEERRRRVEEALQQESEAVAVRLRNEARTLQRVGEAYEEVM
jgi:hypothetical protein